ncbi:MAG: flagellar biosynthesis protein FliQ [Actinobacteria bacterium]|nr:flagellar biosynthesis protein FliQ [Actinomycetota bacterium]
MNEQTVIEIVSQALVVTAEVAVPILAVSLVVGVVVSLFQAMTQINDYTFTFVPKLIAVAAVLFIAGPWMLQQVVGFTTSLLTSIPHLIGVG